MWLLEIEPLSTVVEPCGQLCKGHENCTKLIKLVTTAKHKDNMFGLSVWLSVCVSVQPKHGHGENKCQTGSLKTNSILSHIGILDCFCPEKKLSPNFPPTPQDHHW